MVFRARLHRRPAGGAADARENRRDVEPRGDLGVGARVFHEKFGYGIVAAQEGNKLEIDFETAGRKRVIDSFVKLEG